MVLHEMGQVDKALQVFLQCLALDEDFPSAKRQVEKVSLSERCARRTGREPVLVPDSHNPEVVTALWFQASVHFGRLENRAGSASKY